MCSCVVDGVCQARPVADIYEVFLVLVWVRRRQPYCTSLPTQQFCLNSCENSVLLLIKMMCKKINNRSYPKTIFFLYFFFRFLFSLLFLFVLQLCRCCGGSSLLSTTRSAEKWKGLCISPLSPMVCDGKKKKEKEGKIDKWKYDFIEFLWVNFQPTQTCDTMKYVQLMYLFVQVTVSSRCDCVEWITIIYIWGLTVLPVCFDVMFCFWWHRSINYIHAWSESGSAICSLI